jgi:hypothetical protein
MSSRSNFDPLISVLSNKAHINKAHINEALGLTAVVGAPWAFAAPTGPPLVLREPQFLEFRPGRSASPTNGLAFMLPGAWAPDFSLQSPCRVRIAIETVILS